MPKLTFTLYVFGKSQRTENMISSLRRMLDEGVGGEYELRVCDVREEPQQAEQNKILATPTLVLTSPPPARVIVGDLTDTGKVFGYLAGLIGG